MSETDWGERVIETSTPDRFCSERLWGGEKYSLQNMLIRQVKFPARGKSKELADVWDDRCFEASRKAYDLVIRPSETKSGGGDACDWYRNCPPKEFLAYAQALLDNGAWGGDDAPKVTGARMIRFTNVSSGYPTYRWDFYFGSQHTPPARVNDPFLKTRRTRPLTLDDAHFDWPLGPHGW